MSFTFEPKVTVMDMWKLSMRRIYRSMIGVCNIVLAGALIAVTFRFWNEIGDIMKSIMFFCCILFPVLQPISIYMRAAKQIKGLPRDIVLEINDTGLHITADNQKSHIQWNGVRGCIRETGMLIVAVDGGRGYMLTDRVLGDQKEGLIEFIDSKLNK